VPNDEAPIRTLPRWTGLAVFVFVVLAIAAVLIATRIPHAKRPSIQPAPVTSIVTITTTHTPTR
jgi:hypothetical protein